MAKSPFSHVLSSAIGGGEATPVVTRIDIPRACVIFLCTDGLTKHVTNQEIAAAIESMTSSEQLCHAMLQLALDRGGSDNVTIISARAPLPADVSEDTRTGERPAAKPDGFAA